MFASNVELTKLLINIMHQISYKNIADNILKILEKIWNNRSSVALHAPCFRGNEKRYLADCVDSTFVSSVGKYVDLFEKMLVDYTGIKHAVAVVNGTCALHVALQLAGVVPGDEVIVPALSFVATANAVKFCGAVPHFVDSEFTTLGIDSGKLDIYLDDIIRFNHQTGCAISVNKYSGRQIKAVVPMHTFGHPVDLEPLIEVCNKYKITIVEDAAESLGSLYKGKHTGGFGRLGILSFNGNKIITTGGGGAILTNDDTLAKKAKYLTTTAKRPHPWKYFHDEIGFNYRMPNINAALGCAQLEQLPVFLESKRRLAKLYKEEFANISGVSFFCEPDFARSNYWLNVLLLSKETEYLKDDILETTNTAGYMSRPAWVLLNRLPMFSDCPAMVVDNAEKLEKRIINIPSSSEWNLLREASSPKLD